MGVWEYGSVGVWECGSENHTATASPAESQVSREKAVQRSNKRILNKKMYGNARSEKK